MDREAQTMRGLYPNAQVGTCNWMTCQCCHSVYYNLKIRIPRFAHQSLARRSRSALVTTDTELIAMAAPAKIGDSSKPKTG